MTKQFTPAEVALWGGALNGGDPILASIAAKSKPAAPAAAAAPVRREGRPLSPVDRAIGEILRNSGPGLMNPDLTNHDELRRVVAATAKQYEDTIMKGSQAQRDALYAGLVHEWRNAETKPERDAFGYTLDVLMRAIEHEQADAKGEKLAPLDRTTFLEKSKTYVAYADGPDAYWEAKGGRPAAADAAAPSAAAASADDAEPSTPYKETTYAATGTPRGTVREAQLYLESLGLTTGKGNSHRFGAGQTGKAAMDGIPGPATDAAIRKFQEDNKLEVTGALDDATMAKLKEVAGPKLAAAQAQASDAPAKTEPAAEATAAPAKAAPATAGLSADAKKAARAAMAATVGINDVGKDSKSLLGEQADDYSNYVGSKNDIAKMFKEHLGIDMTPAQLARMTYDKETGRISSQDILNITKALNASRGDAKALEENANWDARMTQIAQQPGMKDFIKVVFNSVDVVSVGAPGTTPGQGNGGSKAQGQG